MCYMNYFHFHKTLPSMPDHFENASSRPVEVNFRDGQEGKSQDTQQNPDHLLKLVKHCLLLPPHADFRHACMFCGERHTYY